MFSAGRYLFSESSSLKLLYLINKCFFFFQLLKEQQRPPFAICHFTYGCNRKKKNSYSSRCLHFAMLIIFKKGFEQSALSLSNNLSIVSDDAKLKPQPVIVCRRLRRRINSLLLVALEDRNCADLHTFEGEISYSCMAESIQLKLPFFCVKQFAIPTQSGDLSKVVVFSVYTIYLNSIITDNLLANFKAKCA